MTRVYLLGGLGTFGMNGLIIEDEGRRLLVDAGLRFLSDPEAFGHRAMFFGLDEDLALDGVVLTHAHEDHIGALPHLGLDGVPLWATPFTAAFIKKRFENAGRKAPAIQVVDVGERTTCAGFDVEFVAVNHSIPDSTALSIHTTAGRVIHSGDFRMSAEALLGRPTDMARLEQIGDDGVAVLFADSTGALTPGATAPDTTLLEPLVERLTAHDGMAVLSTYARHVERHLVIAEACRRAGRRLCVVGRSIPASLSAAGVTLGPAAIARGELTSVPRKQRAVLVSGCQGERDGNLMRIARGEVPHVELEAGDAVWLSARVIPGSEPALRALSNVLAQNSVSLEKAVCHTSGHGGREDLEALLLAVRPQTVVPVHGATAQLLAHADLAEAAGVPAIRALEGDVLDLSSPVRIVEHRPPRVRLIEGNQARDDDVRPLRRTMASAGVCAVDMGHDPPRVALMGTHHKLDAARLADALRHKDAATSVEQAVRDAAGRMGARAPAVMVLAPD